MSLKLVSLNIEGQKHLPSVRAFLGREAANVVCLMEVSKEDVAKLANPSYPYYEFAQNDVIGNIQGHEGAAPIGVAILSRYELKRVERYYPGRPIRTAVVPRGSGTHAPIVLLGEVEVGQQRYKIGAVHYTWTPSASISDEQRRDVEKLIETMGSKEVLLCGDFNIQRGNEMYQQLKSKWRDNIPAEIETTLDPVLHYANKTEEGKLKLVVDYVWSSPKYRVENVRVVPGVSDHCAVVAAVEKI